MVSCTILGDAYPLIVLASVDTRETHTLFVYIGKSSYSIVAAYYSSDNDVSSSMGGFVECAHLNRAV